MTIFQGDVAQMVERALSMREVRGSMQRISNFIEFQFLFLLHGSIRKVIIHDYTKLFSTSFFHRN